MATNILSVSIPLDLAQFLEENPEISPSKIVQTQLYNMKNEAAKQKELIKAYEIKLSRATRRLNAALEVVESDCTKEVQLKIQDVLDKA